MMRLFAFSLLFLASSVLAKNVTIDIVTDGAGCPIAVEPNDPCGDGEDVCFSKGEPNRVSWKYKGSSTDAPDFQIVMKSSADHAIFDSGCHDSAKKVSCDIADGASAGSYAYSVVNAEGCEYDPKIIIND